MKFLNYFFFFVLVLSTAVSENRAEEINSTKENSVMTTNLEDLQNKLNKVDGAVIKNSEKKIEPSSIIISEKSENVLPKLDDFKEEKLALDNANLHASANNSNLIVQSANKEEEIIPSLSKFSTYTSVLDNNVIARNNTAKKDNLIFQNVENEITPTLGKFSEYKSIFDTKVIAKQSTSNVSVDDVNISSSCPSDVPCIPMYNKFVMKLDEKVSQEQLAKNNLTSVTDNQGIKEKLVEKSYPRAVPSIFKFKGSELAKSNKASMSQQDYLITDLMSKGVFIRQVKTEKAKQKDGSELVDDLETASTNELIDRKQKIYELMGVSGNFIKAYSEAEDKSDFIRNLGLSKANGIIDSNINSLLMAYDGVNSEISTRLNFTEDESYKFAPQGKILFPIYSVPKSMTYVQTGLTSGTKGRNIAHVAIGERFYPQATDMKDLGHHMIGINAVFDKDLTRGHKRGSIGLEYMNDNLKLIANIYRRLSNWKDSIDFEKGYVEERPASGWDVFAEWWCTAKLGLNIGVTHWIGKDISPFGDSDESTLEDSPYIYELGVKYTPVPAITIEAKHQRTSHSKKNSYLGINFNIPLGDNFSFADAFNPNSVNRAQGNNIQTSRSMFIQRDYTMPLQYRSKPYMYYIKKIQDLGDDRYLFRIEDGFHRGAPNVPITVTASHPSVKFSNGGHYITDANGYFVVEVIHSAVTKTTISITAGMVTNQFEITIEHLDWLMKASPNTFERFETSNVTLYMEGSDLDGIAGIPVEWRLEGSKLGELSRIDHEIGYDGKANVLYTPDTTQLENYDVDVVATVYGIDFKQTLHVVIYGNGDEDFTANPLVIDGGSYSTLTYKNLKPNTSVDVKIVGVCRLQNDKPQEPLEMSGTEAEGQTITVPVNEEGIATTYAVGSTIVGDTGKCVVTTKTLDEHFQTPPSLEIKSNVYDPSWVLPPSVLYLEPFTATLSELKDDTKVDFMVDTNTAKLKFGSLSTFNLESSLKARTRVRLAVAPNNDSAVKTVKVVEEKASTDYIVTGDYSVQSVEGIHAKYYHDAKNTATDINASVLTINQYYPTFEITAEEQRKLDLFSGKDVIEVTLANGQPYRNISIDNLEGNVELEYPSAFDTSGRVKVLIKGLDKRTNEPFSIVANAMGKVIELKDFVFANKLNYHIYAPVIVETKSLTTGEVYENTLPKFLGQNNTLDYKNKYQFTFTGLLPNTAVSVSGNNITFDNNQGTTDYNGNVTFNSRDITDFNIKNVAFNLSYLVNSVEASRTTQNYSMSMNDYQLAISSDANSVNEFNATTVRVSGGKPNEIVNWSIEGQGLFNNGTQAITSVFDGSGNSSIVVNGNPTSKDNLKFTVTANTLAKTVSKDIDVTVTSYDLAQENVTIDWNTAGSLTVSGLREGTTVDYSSPYVSGNSSTVGSNGTAVISLNKYVGAESTLSFDVTYNTTMFDRATKTVNFGVKQYSPTITSDLSSVVEGNGTTVRVSGAKSGETISFSISGQGVWADNGGQETRSTTIASDGTALINVKGNPTSLTNPTMRITANTCGKQIIKDITITYPTYNLSQDALTLDWNSSGTATLRGLRAGTTVTYSSGYASGTSATVNSSGIAYIGINKYSSTASSISFNVTYYKNKFQTTTGTVTVGIYQHTLAISRANDIVDNGTSQITVSGGKAGEAVSWSISGNGTFTTKYSNFDGSGNAYATVQGVSPYSSTITVTAYGCAKSSSVNIGIRSTPADYTIYSNAVIQQADLVKSITINMPSSSYSSLLTGSGYNAGSSGCSETNKIQSAGTISQASVTVNGAMYKSPTTISVSLPYGASAYNFVTGKSETGTPTNCSGSNGCMACSLNGTITTPSVTIHYR